MSLELLSRFQFAFTIGFHYLFPPLSIGLGLFLVIMEGTYIATKNQVYERIARFWVKIFGLIFALGVATGIVMEFEFGLNWANYSRFVGDVFGSALAAEGIFAFFLESGFLAILLFGWDKVKPRTHFISTCLVAFGAHFSAIWIVVANSWQQTPAGYHLVQTPEGVRAQITDFWQVVFSPSFIDRITHVFMGAWQAAAFFVLSVSAYYLLKNKHVDFAKGSMKIGIAVAVVASLLQLFTGDQSAKTMAATQPAKLAAIEAFYPASAPAPEYLFGWVDENNQKVIGVGIPGLLSFLLYYDASKPVTGLNAFPPEDWPPVGFVFQTFHLMVAIGFLLIFLALLSAVKWKTGSLFKSRWLLYILVFAVVLPEISNELGWFTAEVGRQPWIVYGLLRTKDGLSVSVGEQQVLISLILFAIVYILLLALFIYLLNATIKGGPEVSELEKGPRI